jgi:hypothetical protein
MRPSSDVLAAMATLADRTPAQTAVIARRVRKVAH